MTGGILTAVAARLDDPAARFVFPSEVAASSVLVAALAATGRKALPARRFIGWDAFKAEVFAGDGRGRPSSKAIRSIFARMLALDNARAPFLRSVIPAAAASASVRFSSSIASALPALWSIPDVPGDHVADWREIRRRYEAFMAARGLYEAAWLGREAAAGRDHWVFLYTDLTEDWDDYADATLALPGSTSILSPEMDGRPVQAARFGTVVEEIRAVLLTIRDAVDAGADPAGIVISAASPESVLPILEREAAVAGVPLDAREGRPLSESSGGRLLADAVALARGRMSFDDLRRLLLDASRPWKEKEAGRRLLGIGIRKHLVAPLPGGADAWESSIGNDDEARRLYRGLRTAASRLSDAPGFRSLRSAFDAFRRAFLDESAWSPRQNDEIARCLAVLDELEEAAEAAGLPPDAIPGAADAYLEQLDETRYLPVSDSGGIAVYRFPVAAGAMPDTHFVVNLAQGAAAAAARPLSFMRADERDRLGASDRDISAGLVRLLAASGRRVYLSYSEDGPDGVRPPHPAIDARPAAELGLAYGRERWLPNLEADAAPAPAVFPSQADGARAALGTVFGPEARGGRTVPDWSRGTPDSPVVMGPESAAAVRGALTRAGILSLSATAMEDYGTCAFRRVFRRSLRVEPVESGLSFIDNRLLGGIYHNAFSVLFRPLAELRASIVSGAPADDGGEEPAGESARPDQAAIAGAIRAAMNAVARELGPMAAMLIESAAPALERNFSLAAAELLAALDGQVPRFVDDADLTAPLPGIETQLYGRPDLVCVAAGDDSGRRAVIVDYKKSVVPAKKDLEPRDDGTVGDIQIPVYKTLAEEAGLEPESAYYLSIEGYGARKKRLLLAFGPDPQAAIPPGKMALLKPALEAVAARTAGIINRGEIFVPQVRDRETVCQGCDLRSVCRARYAVR